LTKVVTFLLQILKNTVSLVRFELTEDDLP